MKKKQAVTLLLSCFLLMTLIMGCTRDTVINSNPSTSPSAPNDERSYGASKVTGESTVSPLDVGDFFVDLKGCMVIFDTHANEYLIYNDERVLERMTPCSTFKIWNSLFSLDSGVVNNVDSVIKWDGTDHGWIEWNKDLSLREGIKVSAVWVYQELARRIGQERMQNYLDSINYGNAVISGGIDTFWLRSSLEISAKEQVDLLRKFYTYDIPFKEEDIDAVKEIIVVQSDNFSTLSGKTGSAIFDGKAKLNWYVGYIEINGNVLYFATNVSGEELGMKAKDISFEVLKHMELIK